MLPSHHMHTQTAQICRRRCPLRCTAADRPRTDAFEDPPREARKPHHTPFCATAANKLSHLHSVYSQVLTQCAPQHPQCCSWCGCGMPLVMLPLISDKEKLGRHAYNNQAQSTTPSRQTINLSDPSTSAQAALQTGRKQLAEAEHCDPRSQKHCQKGRKKPTTLTTSHRSVCDRHCVNRSKALKAALWVTTRQRRCCRQKPQRSEKPRQLSAEKPECCQRRRTRAHTSQDTTQAQDTTGQGTHACPGT